MSLGACTSVRSPSPPIAKRVLVIGSGIAGLTAAAVLQRAGHVVTVLEANTKPGGRLRTRREGNFVFDEGASWIHGPEGNPLATLAEEAGAKTFLTEDDNAAVYDGKGKAISDQAIEAAESALQPLLDQIEEAGRRDKSIQQVLTEIAPERLQDPLWQYMLSAYLEFDTGARLDQVSSLHFQDDRHFGGADRIITNGFDTVVNHLAKNLDVRPGHRVYRLNVEGKSVRAHTAVRSFEADAAVVAVPLGVLKRGDIAFEPALSGTKQDAIERLGMGVVNKCLMTWDDPFWDPDVQYFGLTGARPGLFNYWLNVQMVNGQDALMTFALGSEAEPFEAMGDAEVAALILEKCRTVWGSSVKAPSRILRTAWARDPFTWGAYSYVAVGSSPADYEHLAAVEADRIAFAGEHTTADYRATVHGALLSGILAAESLSGVLD